MTLKKLFETVPMARWDATFTDMRPDDAFNLDRAAVNTAVMHARIAAYWSKRIAGGTHADAVKAQNRVARQVRKALGFTYPDDKLTF